MVVIEQEGHQSGLVQDQNLPSLGASNYAGVEKNQVNSRSHHPWQCRQPQVNSSPHSLVGIGSLSLGRGLFERGSEKQKLDKSNLILSFTDEEPGRAE